MEIITGFESAAIEVEEKAHLHSKYIEVLKALEHSLEVAENAFSRIAKGQFHKLVGQISRKRADEVGGMFPYWYAEAAITIDLQAKDPHNVYLAQLVENFGRYLLSSLTLSGALVESLNTKILNTGSTRYQFRLKQRWVRDVG